MGGTVLGKQILYSEILGEMFLKCSFLPGIDQYDRDSIINDFKNGACRLMVATSVAARGLDVKQLILVVNYNCPNHYEDYVHRAGRTGRAGNKVIQSCFCWRCVLRPFSWAAATMISFLSGLCLHFHHRRPGSLRWGHHQSFGAVGLFCPAWTGTTLGVVQRSAESGMRECGGGETIQSCV